MWLWESDQVSRGKEMLWILSMDIADFRQMVRDMCVTGVPSITIASGFCLAAVLVSHCDTHT